MMKNIKKKLKNQTKIVKVSFTGSNITKYAGLNAVANYMNRQNIIKSISLSFPTAWYNATKFGINPVKSAMQNGSFNRDNQIIIAVTLSSISGVSRICRIATFSGDGLIKTFLKLDKAINREELDRLIEAANKTYGRSHFQ